MKNNRKSKLEGAIRLPSSGEIFEHDNCDVETSVLIDLLEESEEKKLSMDTKVIFTKEFLNLRKIPDNYSNLESYLQYKEQIISVKGLHDLYEKFYHREYTPEGEKERFEFEMEDFEKQAQKRSAWGFYSAQVRYSNEIEEERKAFGKEGKKGLEKLKEKKSKQSNHLIIG
ncbi:MAG: hypothetical protein WC812_00735 [Candidatus Pacearchaeota archaeon]|jgi:hypothetical protein